VPVRGRSVPTDERKLEVPLLTDHEHGQCAAERGRVDAPEVFRRFTELQLELPGMETFWPRQVARCREVGEAAVATVLPMLEETDAL
jgi:hypothetical protein